MKKVFLSLVMVASVGIAGDIEDGIAFYDKGDYVKAAKLFQKACDGGDF